MSQQQANQQEADDFGNRPSQELTAMSVHATEGGRNDERGPDSIQVQPNERMPGKGIVVAEEESRASSSPSRSEPISKTVEGLGRFLGPSLLRPPDNRYSAEQ